MVNNATFTFAVLPAFTPNFTCSNTVARTRSLTGGRNYTVSRCARKSSRHKYLPSHVGNSIPLQLSSMPENKEVINRTTNCNQNYSTAMATAMAIVPNPSSPTATNPSLCGICPHPSAITCGGCDNMTTPSAALSKTSRSVPAPITFALFTSLSTSSALALSGFV